MSDAIKRAEEFLSRERAFRLGELLTESSHPKTKTLSQTAEDDLPAAIKQLQSVDDDIPLSMKKVLQQDSFRELIEAFVKALSTGKRIYFTGCGATGRLSILLESAWRRFLGEIKKVSPEMGKMGDRVYSVMAGGDFALIKSVEGYEDFQDFGRYQLRERGVGPGDVVVAITEGGETPFVIGTAWEGLDAGAKVFFVYNNPTEVLCRYVKRSREVIEEPRITKLDLTTGPMAITGSTRMQATTAELFVVGSALEIALVRFLRKRLSPMQAAKLGLEERQAGDYLRLLSELLEQLSSPQVVDTLARAIRFEEGIYRRRGLVTYMADSFLLDVLTDTTERSPTFMLPAFRKYGDNRSPSSWAFVKDPFRTTEKAWHELLQREPRGLKWGRKVYEQLKAPAGLKAQPPKLDNSEIYKFMIGNEPDPSRTDAPDSALVVVTAGGRTDRLIRTALQKFGSQYKKTAALIVGSADVAAPTDETFQFPCSLSDSPLQLWHHLAVKLILNTLSTATMVRMGRVIGNAMVWLSPSNKKLIDRGSRLIAQQAECSYEQACIALHEAMEEVESGKRQAQSRENRDSPVALAIERLGGKGKRYQKSEDRGQRTEDRGQKTETLPSDV
ncbi:MAG: sugar phosphate isomerase [Planctomycetes bacterium]|nr:sugar phosphate isomerase [Planctomycetota bacterium]